MADTVRPSAAAAVAVRPRIGVSRCLLGEAVRYDGRHRLHPAVTELAAVADLVAVCPEVELGLGVPREPIWLQETPEGLRLVSATGRDLTELMARYAAARVRALGQLDGFIAVRGSPSCALASAEVRTRDGGLRHDGEGRFIAVLRTADPELPVIEDRELDDPVRREVFLAGVWARAHRRVAPGP